MSDSNTWRHPKERKELVERVIKAERKNRELVNELRAVTSTPGGGFNYDAMLERWQNEGVAGVHAELVDQQVAVPRRKVRDAIEALGLDPAVVRAVVIDRQNITVVRRDDRSFRYLILEDSA